MTKAIILAAGQGSRLKPLTNEIPKCLVNFLGKSLLDYQLDVFKKLKIKKVHIVTGYKEKKIKKIGLTKSINKNFMKSNMVYSLFSSIDFIKGNEDLIISYGDIIFTKENLKKLLKSKSEISLMIDMNYLEYWKIRSTKPIKDLESLIIDKNNNIKEIGKKIKSYKRAMGQYTGLIKIKSSAIKKIIDFYNNLDRKKIYERKSFKNMYMTTFFQILIDSGWKIKPVKVKNGWLEFDTLEDYQKYVELNNLKKLKNFFNFKI